MKKSQPGVLSLAFLMLAAPPLSAEDFNSSMESAREAYKAGNNLEAFKKLRQSMFSIWDNIPLSVIGARLVSDQESFSPRDSNVYSSGEPIHIVCKVVGYKIKKENSLNHINVATDLHVLSEEKEKLMTQKNVGSFDISSPFPNTEFKIDLTYRLSGAPSGKYILKTIIRDKNSDKRTEFSKTIRIES